LTSNLSSKDEGDKAIVAPVPEKKIDKKRLQQLKGVSKDLLEKIRLREQQKLTTQYLTTPPLLQKKEVLEKHLPKVASTLRNLFLAEKKSCLKIEDVVEKLKNSSTIQVTHDDYFVILELFQEKFKTGFCKLLKTEDDGTWVRVDVKMLL